MAGIILVKQLSINLRACDIIITFYSDGHRWNQIYHKPREGYIQGVYVLFLKAVRPGIALHLRSLLQRGARRTIG